MSDRSRELLELSEGRVLQEYRLTIERAARTFLGCTPNHVDLEDLVQAGSLALLEAFRRIRHSHANDHVDHYLRTRIWGSLFDEFRRTSTASRDVLAAMRRMHANGLELPAPRNDAHVRDNVRAVSTTRGQAARERRVRRRAEAGTWSSSPSDQAVLVEARQLLDLVEQAIERLPAAERMVLQLYYLRDVAMHDVGAILGVTESRASQLHHAALARLKVRMRRFAA